MKHNIIQGDCLRIMPTMAENSFDYVLTSPPYNRKRNDKYEFYSDDVDNYFDFIVRATDEMLRIARKGVFLNIQATYYNRQDVYRYIGHYYDKIQEIFIWEKTNPMPACGCSITNSVEYFIYLSDSRPLSNTTYTKNIIKTSVTKMPKEHKAVMNDKACDFFISKFMNLKDSVLDPFAGIGTTLMCCKRRGLPCTGIEISKEYCSMAEKKLSTLF